MADQTNIISIIDLINNNNKITCTLPSSKKEVKIDRLNISILEKIDKIFDSEVEASNLFNYYEFLVNIVKERVSENLNYIDFVYIIFKLRQIENNKFEDIDLTAVEPGFSNDVTFDKSNTIKDLNISYTLNYSLPTIQKLQKLIKICEKDTKGLLFYTLFKFIDSIQIEVDGNTSTADTIEDMYKVYKVISYKALDQFGITPNKITEELYNLYKINIESDTRFLLSV